eukprot:Amastigsp_a341848_13.p3 type:complete len:116 gc:universal Amastigsp_a341848_13:640-293(-)
MPDARLSPRTYSSDMVSCVHLRSGSRTKPVSGHGSSKITRSDSFLRARMLCTHAMRSGLSASMKGSVARAYSSGVSRKIVLDAARCLAMWAGVQGETSETEIEGGGVVTKPRNVA